MAKKYSKAFKKQARQATIKKLLGLGNLSVLAPEIRNDIYSRLMEDGYKQTLDLKPNGSVQLNVMRSSPHPPFLTVSKTLRNEMLGALTVRRHCKVQVDEHSFVTNFDMLDRDRNRLIIPVCSKISITIDPPSPRHGHSFYRVRLNVHLLVNIINSGTRDVNPRISAIINRAGLQTTYSYNDFAMFFGPFIALQSRCKAVKVCRSIGLPCFHAKVESYCNLIEAAMRGHARAKDELLQHQLLIDIKLPIALMSFNSPPNKMNEPAFQVAARATIALAKWHEDRGEREPEWLRAIRLHLSHSEQTRTIGIALRDLVLGGKSRLDMINWAAGLISLVNPLFDDAAFFGRRSQSQWR